MKMIMMRMIMIKMILIMIVIKMIVVDDHDQDNCYEDVDVCDDDDHAG